MRSAGLSRFVRRADWNLEVAKSQRSRGIENVFLLVDRERENMHSYLESRQPDLKGSATCPVSHLAFAFKNCA